MKELKKRTGELNIVSRQLERVESEHAERDREDAKFNKTWDLDIKPSQGPQKATASTVSSKATSEKASSAKAGKGDKSSTKSTPLKIEPLKPVIGKDEIVLKPGTRDPFETNPFAPPDIQALRTSYGDQQMHQVLINYTATKLREAYDHYVSTKGGAKRSGESASAYKERLVSALAAKAQKLPLYEVGKRFMTEKEKAARDSARTTTADLLRLRIQLARLKA